MHKQLILGAFELPLVEGVEVHVIPSSASFLRGVLIGAVGLFVVDVVTHCCFESSSSSPSFWN